MQDSEMEQKVNEAKTKLKNDIKELRNRAEAAEALLEEGKYLYLYGEGLKSGLSEKLKAHKEKWIFGAQKPEKKVPKELKRESSISETRAFLRRLNSQNQKVHTCSCPKVQTSLQSS